MLPIESFSEVFVDACIRGEEAELLPPSAYGRDTSALEFAFRVSPRAGCSAS